MLAHLLHDGPFQISQYLEKATQNTPIQRMVHHWDAIGEVIGIVSRYYTILFLALQHAENGQ